MATPKRGDTKKINGKTYRWAWSSKQKKFTWVRDHSKDKLSTKEGLRGKDFEGTGKKIGDWTSKTLNKLGLHNRREPSSWNQRQKEKRKERENQPPLKTWRVDSEENKTLQKQRKEGKEETYTKVTKENKDKLSDQQNKNRLKTGNIGKIGSLKLGSGFSERQINSRIKVLKRRNKASDRMKIKRLEALKKKKYG